MITISKPEFQSSGAEESKYRCDVSGLPLDFYWSTEAQEEFKGQAEICAGHLTELRQHEVRTVYVRFRDNPKPSGAAQTMALSLLQDVLRSRGKGSEAEPSVR